MAEIKVQIKGDDADLKAKFKESSAEARVFQENVQKSLDAISEASKNLVSQTGLGGIAKLLGGAGLTGAAVEFSNMLVKGFKGAVSAALDFQGQVGIAGVEGDVDLRIVPRDVIGSVSGAVVAGAVTAY